MSFKEAYPKLFQFFAGYFPDADLENLSDEEVVSNYLTDCNKSEKSRTEVEQSKKEIISLIANIKTYWVEVGEEANRHFNSSTDAVNWLNKVKQELDRKL